MGSISKHFKYQRLHVVFILGDPLQVFKYERLQFLGVYFLDRTGVFSFFSNPDALVVVIASFLFVGVGVRWLLLESWSLLKSIVVFLVADESP